MKAHSSQWNSPRSPHMKNFWQNHSKIKIMLTVFFDWEGVVHHRYTLQTKQLIRSTTSMFFISCDTQYHENSQRYGQLVIGSFIMTMCLLMQHVWCRVFWWNIKSPRWLSPHYSPYIFGTLRLLVFPKLKSPLKGNKFQTIHEIQENTVEQLTAIPTKDFAECFWTVEETLGELCEVPR